MDKKTVAFAILLMVLGLFCIPLLSVFFSNEEYTVQNDPVEKTEFFGEDTSSYPTLLKTEGQKIVNANGEEVVLKGVTAPDPHRLNQSKTYSVDYYNDIFALGGNVIRVPVHPSRFLSDDYYMWRFIDPIVKWAGEHGFYVIIDWDCAGNPITGEGDNLTDISKHVEDKTNDFWALFAKHYKDTPNVIFEVFNEPTTIKPEKWAEMVNGFIQTIRDQGAQQLVIVGCFEGYDISWAEKSGFTGENVALSIHVYPSKTDYEEVIGSYELDMPLIVTSWGFVGNDTAASRESMMGTAESFGQPFVDYLNSKNISWVASYYDDKLEPPMFAKDTTDLNDFGNFIKEQLKK